jgi:predicted RNase H-like HicB family nuclease
MKVTITYFSSRAEDFKRLAMKRARFETLEDRSIYGEIPDCAGVWAKASTRKKCRQELKEVLSDWVDLKREDRDRDFPVIEGIDLNAP